MATQEPLEAVPTTRPTVKTERDSKFYKANGDTVFVVGSTLFKVLHIFKPDDHFQGLIDINRSLEYIS